MMEFCKLSKSGCFPIVKTSKGRRKQQYERITFTMVNSSATFNIIINELRKEDSGIYKCGTGIHSEPGKMIQLQVTEGSIDLDLESVFSNIVSEIQASYEPENASHRHVTPAFDIYKEK
ncbi:hypothetical protein JD844_018435 [Phrynosoma platyrhinos]|uniref:Immunoglobulin V-set domain-containing protein n=1 Tax=Phrynosoma platyrhinos TaxID=52577 RepID=A0ABQ7SNH0_PHRPL|nr:hypothetical protein JD844_018435 [Phrynosoma platyrhinos]